jgi:O-methyltransferase domain
LARLSEEGAALWGMAHLGTPMAIRVAATLRIADHLAFGPKTAEELAGEVKAAPDALDRLMRYLTVRGLFARTGTGAYALTRAGEPLRDGHPDGLRDGLDIEGIGHADLAFVQLLHSVRTGRAGFPLQFSGRTFWQHLETEPARAAAFNSYMRSTTAGHAADIVAGYDWGSLGEVVDVGGGDGTLLTALLRAHRDLRGAVFDLPETAETAARALADAGLDGRGRAIAGSFFDPLPAGADGYILSSVVHDWEDEQAGEILRRCAEAASGGGRVFVVEHIGAAGDSPHTGMDLRMLVLYGGKERTAAELADLAGEAGLDLVAVHPAGVSSIVEFRPRT